MVTRAGGSPGSPDVPALLAVAVTVVSWASAFVVIRWVGPSFAPAPLALGRLLVGVVALGALLAVRRRWMAPQRREWALLLLCGLAWFAAYNVALNAAERLVDAGTAAMLVNVGPLLIALLAGALLGEGFPRWLLAGAGIAFTGTVLIGVATAGGGSADVTGVLLCLLAALTYAAGVLAQKPLLARLPALQVTWTACTIGALACLPAAGGLVDDAARAPAGAVAALVYLGAVPTALAFGTWAFALSRMPAGRLAVATYLSPPLAVLGSWALLGEAPPLLALAGGALALVGVALSRRTSRPRPAAVETLVEDA
ncbi:DMT family transporter [Kineococcus glutinatus]|uniref:DMT family transporter n=1 Tax=Kineococcus glutinatus TaxID=1070872 RepID=A0ABP9HW36_9ACTN